MSEKPGRKKGYDPVKKKAKDLARQRKIYAFSSDKGSRKSVPIRKAMANRAIRHSDKQFLNQNDLIEENADQLSHAHKMKWQKEQSVNAAKRREKQALRKNKPRKRHAVIKAYLRGDKSEDVLWGIEKYNLMNVLKDA